MAVVDPDLRVRGIERLRICDSSIMPRLVSSNTNAPSIMIGEKAVDLVLGHRASTSTTRETRDLFSARWRFLSTRSIVLPHLGTVDLFNFSSGAIEGVIAAPAGPLRV